MQLDPAVGLHAAVRRLPIAQAADALQEAESPGGRTGRGTGGEPAQARERRSGAGHAKADTWRHLSRRQ